MRFTYLSRSVELAILLLAAACGSASPKRVPSHASGAVTPPTAEHAIEPASWLPARGAWLDRVFVEHPLIGTIYSPEQHRLVTPAEMVDKIHGARYLLLGEKHDNRDHHQVQANLLSLVLQAHKDPAVAFEMLDQEQQPTVDAFLSAHPTDVDGLAVAVEWERSGWPQWSMYRPVFSAAIDSKARIVAANLSRKSVHVLMHRGESELAKETEQVPPLPVDQLRDLEDELRASHCGMLPELAISRMAWGQRLRDWTIAEHLLKSDHGTGAVLIAGVGHVRLDRGVPLSLRAATSGPVLSVALMEVQHGVVDPAAYLDSAASLVPYDFVLFTPRVDNNDPCEEMQQKEQPTNRTQDKSTAKSRPTPLLTATF